MSETHMTCADCDELFLDYFESDLDASTATAVDKHVAGCARCHGLVRDMDGIRESAANLPDLAPSRDLWEGVEARIQPSVVSIARPARGAGVSRSLMAVAAAGLVIVSSSITYVGTSRSITRDKKPAAAKAAEPVLRVAGATVEAAPVVDERVESTGPATTVRSSPAPVRTPARTPARTSARTPAGRSLRGVPSARIVQPASTSSEIAIADEIDKLQQLLGERRSELEPETVKVVEDNLAIIDAAVAQARAAVARDPASGFLNERLENALHKKVQLLRTVALLRSST